MLDCSFKYIYFAFKSKAQTCESHPIQILSGLPNTSESNTIFTFGWVRSHMVQVLTQPKLQSCYKLTFYQVADHMTFFVQKHHSFSFNCIPIHTCLIRWLPHSTLSWCKASLYYSPTSLQEIMTIWTWKAMACCGNWQLCKNHKEALYMEKVMVPVILSISSSQMLPLTKGSGPQKMLIGLSEKPETASFSIFLCTFIYHPIMKWEMISCTHHKKRSNVL